MGRVAYLAQLTLERPMRLVWKYRGEQDPLIVWTGVKTADFETEEGPGRMTPTDGPIAEVDRRAKQQPWRAYIEAFTLMALVGDPTDKAVIDIACGEGFYSRMIRERGAAKVTGVDLSEKMI